MSGVNVARRDEIPPGRGKAVAFARTRVALFDVAGELFAISDTCPHAGASLANGWVEDGVVVCPWHGARFDLRTGSTAGPPAHAGVRCYRATADGEHVRLAED